MTSSDKPTMTAQGLNSSRLLLFPDKVRIERKGLNSMFIHGMAGDNDIAISSISAIQFKKSGKFTSGFMQFAFNGAKQSFAGMINPVRNENTIMFNPKQQPEFEAIKTEIEKRINNPAPNPSFSSIGDLDKLADLRDKGIITPAEFEAKKKQILGI